MLIDLDRSEAVAAMCGADPEREAIWGLTDRYPVRKTGDACAIQPVNGAEGA